LAQVLFSGKVNFWQSQVSAQPPVGTIGAFSFVKVLASLAQAGSSNPFCWWLSSLSRHKVGFQSAMLLFRKRFELSLVFVWSASL